MQLEQLNASIKQFTLNWIKEKKAWVLLGQQMEKTSIVYKTISHTVGGRLLVIQTSHLAFPLHSVGVGEGRLWIDFPPVVNHSSSTFELFLTKLLIFSVNNYGSPKYRGPLASAQSPPFPLGHHWWLIIVSNINERSMNAMDETTILPRASHVNSSCKRHATMTSLWRHRSRVRRGVHPP